MQTADLSEADFERISRLVYEQCGINLHDGKKELVKARLGKRLREKKFHTFRDYFRHVTSSDGQEEFIAMIDSLSTNLTFFFREQTHFDRLTSILDRLRLESAGAGSSLRIRIWSAGCSSGEEPYSIGIVARECLGGSAADVRILASDISTRVLATASRGIYPRDKLKNVPAGLLRRYFQIGCNRWEGHCRIKPEIRDLVQFQRINLMDKPATETLFDIIFCRNVMIYFDKKTQGSLVGRFWHCLNKGGYLFVGHSESLTGLEHPFKYVAPSVYRK